MSDAVLISLVSLCGTLFVGLLGLLGRHHQQKQATLVKAIDVTVVELRAENNRLIMNVQHSNGRLDHVEAELRECRSECVALTRENIELMRQLVSRGPRE